MRMGHVIEQNVHEFTCALDNMETDEEILDFITSYRYAINEGRFLDGKSLAWRIGWSTGNNSAAITPDGGG